MSYTPTEWKTGDVITAEKLNNMESGIVDNEKVFIIHATGLAGHGNSQTQPTLDKTYEEIASAYNAGMILAVMGDVVTDSGITARMFIPFVSTVELEPGNLIYAFTLHSISIFLDKASLVEVVVNVTSSATMSFYEQKNLAYTT